MNSIGIDYAKLGFCPVGVHISWNIERNEKQLVFPKQWTSATLETYPKYFSKHDNGIALLTGDKSDLIVVDCDVLKQKDKELNMLDGTVVFQALIDKYGVPDCPTARSSSGGMHYFFSLSKSLENGLIRTKNTSKITVKKGLLDDKHDCRSITIDTRGDGGCIVVAPTQYAVNGKKRAYQWIRSLTASFELPAMPSWCIELLNESCPPASPKSRVSVLKDASLVKHVSTTLMFFDHNVFLKQTKDHIERMQQSILGKTWERTNGYDYTLIDKTKPCVCCLNVHTSNNYMVREVCDSCYWTRNYSTKCNGNVYNWETHPLLKIVLESPSTDAPYSRMLHERYHKIGFSLVSTLKNRFLNFNGIVWEELPQQVVVREIESICIPILDYLVKYMDTRADSEGEGKKKLLQRKLFNQARNYLRKNTNLNNIAAHYKQIYIDVDIEKHLDQNPNLLAVKNGIIDLKTGKLREGREDDFMFTQLDTIYEEHGNTVLITEFVNSIFNNDQDTIVYVQKLLGYGISGHTSEQCWIMFTGTGSNGKSLLISLIEALMENWFVTAAYDVFFKSDRRSQAGGAAPHLAALKNARFCVKEETEPKDKLNVEMLKIITGESTVTARQLYTKEYESFTPTALPILLCNHKPVVDIEDDAMMRRIKVIPFNNVYTTPDDINRPYDKQNSRHRLKDPELRTKLLTAYAQEQLLTWLVQGAVKWYKEGLGPQPQNMIDAFKSYCDENDKLKMFIDAKCERPPPGLQKSGTKEYFVNAGVFRDALNEYCSTKYMQKDLIEMMEKRGFKYTVPRGVKGRVFTGLRMI